MLIVAVAAAAVVVTLEFAGAFEAEIILQCVSV